MLTPAHIEERELRFNLQFYVAKLNSTLLKPLFFRLRLAANACFERSLSDNSSNTGIKYDY